jgi:hypothetical protein
MRPLRAQKEKSREEKAGLAQDAGPGAGPEKDSARLKHTWASHMPASGADLAYVSAQRGHANPSITLRIYSRWIPAMRRIRTGVLNNKKNAGDLQVEADGKEFENAGLPQTIDSIAGAEEDRTHWLP